MRELQALPAVVGVERKLYPKTWANVRFRADAELTAADFRAAVRAAGYRAIEVTFLDEEP